MFSFLVIKKTNKQKKLFLLLVVKGHAAGQPLAWSSAPLDQTFLPWVSARHFWLCLSSAGARTHEKDPSNMIPPDQQVSYTQHTSAAAAVWDYFLAHKWSCPGQKWRQSLSAEPLLEERLISFTDERKRDAAAHHDGGYMSNSSQLHFMNNLLTNQNCLLTFNFYNFKIYLFTTCWS